MTTAFQRTANTILKDAGYQYLGANGSNHEVWRKDGVPDIHVPGTPSGGRDSMLARVRRAVRKGTPLNPPSGQETDVAAPPGKRNQVPLSEKLVNLASSYLVKKANDKRERMKANVTTARTPDPQYGVEIAKWLRRCIEAHGALPNSEITAAAKKLELDATHLSHGRREIGAVSYRTKDMERRAFVTDFAKRVPAGAIVAGGASPGPPKVMQRMAAAAAAPEAERAPEKREVKPRMRTKGTGRNGDVDVRTDDSLRTPPVDVGELPPPDPAHTGRRLDRGGLTDAEHQEAERRMSEAHRKAEEERQAVLAERGETMQVVAGETNGKRQLSGLEAAVELLVAEALAATFSLTDADIRTLRGIQETQRRHAEESTAAAGQIGLLLQRVAATKEQAVPA